MKPANDSNAIREKGKCPSCGAPVNAREGSCEYCSSVWDKSVANASKRLEKEDPTNKTCLNDEEYKLFRGSVAALSVVEYADFCWRLLISEAESRTKRIVTQAYLR